MDQFSTTSNFNIFGYLTFHMMNSLQISAWNCFPTSTSVNLTWSVPRIRTPPKKPCSVLNAPFRFSDSDSAAHLGYPIATTISRVIPKIQIIPTMTSQRLYRSRTGSGISRANQRRPRRPRQDHRPGSAARGQLGSGVKIWIWRSRCGIKVEGIAVVDSRGSNRKRRSRWARRLRISRVRAFSLGL